MPVKNSDKRFLKKNIIKEIIKPEYNNFGTPFKLSGRILPEYRSNQYANIQEEKRLQWLSQLQMEALLNKEIIEENQHTDISGQHDGFILDSVLFEQIKIINKNHINKFIQDNPSYDFDDIAKKIKHDFVNRVKVIFDSADKTKNIQLHELYFNENKELKIKVKNETIHYNVIDCKDATNNEITIIKEKKLAIGQKHEFPDFAVYYNGLPFIVIEMKKTTVNGECGTREAANDYYKKKTYHNFLACIGSNASKAFISCSPNLLDPYIWENYPDLEKSVTYYDSEDRNGFYDILCELVTSRKNMLFYFESCTMISETGDYLKNARIQQYFTAKQFFDKMSSPNNKNGFKAHFQHHTRTGKSFTFKIIAKMAYRKLNHKYKKCIFFTHDVASVLPSVSKEFRYFDGSDVNKGITLKEIKGKRDYNKTLSANTMFGLYITNMQKIAKDKEIVDSSDGVLIFIDEVHTHQSSTFGTNKKETMADFRKIHFPNATVISATASPLVKEEKVKKETHYRNITAELHGECINKVTPSDSMRLNLVTKLHFSKEKFQSGELKKMKAEFDQKNEDESKIIESEIMKAIEERLIEGTLEEYEEKNKVINKVRVAYNNIVVTKDNYSNVISLNEFEEETPEHKQMFSLLCHLDNAIEVAVNRLKSSVKSQFRQDFWIGTLREKIENIVIPEILKQREECANVFTPKFFYVVNSRMDRNDLTNGEKMLNVVKEMIKDHIKNNPDADKLEYNIKNNVYKGVRFGFDSSEEEDRDNGFNGDLEGKRDITALFEIDPLEGKSKTVKNPCDVLILVRKKLMGYDNKNLTTVFLDKDIDESNIKEMLQLATRGTTKRKGKLIGYIKDLTFGNRNVETFKKAFAIYDEKEGIKEFLFDEEEIVETIGKVRETKSDLETLFLSEKISPDINNKNVLEDKSILEITEYVKAQYWKWRGKDEDDQEGEFINKYIELITKLERAFKALVSPSFILEKKNEESLLENVLSIFWINSELLTDIKNKNTNIYKKRYTNEEIVKILEQTFSSFGGVKAFVDKIELRYKNSQLIESPEVYIVKERKTALSSTLGKLKSDLSNFDGELTGRISEELDQISHLIDTNSGDLAEQAIKISGYEQKIKAMKDKEQQIIDNEYSGNRALFKICKALHKEFGEENKDLLLAFANNLDKNIILKRNLISESNCKESLLNVLIKEVNFKDNKFIDREKNKIDPKYKERCLAVYKAILKADSGLLSIEEEKLQEELDNGVPFDYITNSNVIFKILREYMNG